MEMRAIEDTAMARDLTPPLSPLAFALHDSALESHCSACFSPLPATPFPRLLPAFPHNSPHVPDDVTPMALYCSPRCSKLDSPLHFSSAETQLLSLFRRSPPPAWSGSSDLRLSLRLLQTFQKLGLFSRDCRLKLRRGKKDDPWKENNNLEGQDENLHNRAEKCGVTEVICDPKDGELERIAGLMTNRERLVFSGSGERIREGAEAIAAARMMCAGAGMCVKNQRRECAVEEMVLCLILTNAVEVQDRSGRCLGVAVYGTTFSWINHSCSPNACYRFLMGSEHYDIRRLRNFSAGNSDRCGSEMEDGERLRGGEGYGPRVIVRSIKSIEKGDEVTVAYTDLLQPREMRREELWLKYRFSCSCKRCNSPGSTYVDRALQMVSSMNLCSTNVISDHVSYKEEEIKELTEAFDEAIASYVSFSDPEQCCEKLEILLTYGNSDGGNSKTTGEKSCRKPKLHLFHHLSIDAYTTLASAYKIRASDLLFDDSMTNEHGLAFDMYKTSAAYSLLLAGVSHYLFAFEPSLIASVANFWTSAGETLQSLSNSSLWELSLNSKPLKLDTTQLLSQKCEDCSFMGIFGPNSENGQDHTVRFQELKKLLLNCIANLVSIVWSTLTTNSSFLKLITDPIDFSWLESAEYEVSHSDYRLPGERLNKVRISLILLAVHCLRYGALLSSICYGFAPSNDVL